MTDKETVKTTRHSDFEEAIEAARKYKASVERKKKEKGEPVHEYPPWTRIEDAKPIVGQPVLVFYKGFAFPDTATFTGVGCGWARDEEFDWQWDEVVNPITHWMPLPAGPDYHCITTPPQRTWVGLTDEEINQAYADSYKGVPLHEGIEAKLKEKNT